MWRMFSGILAALVVGTLAFLMVLPGSPEETKQTEKEGEISGVSTYKVNNESEAVSSIQQLKEVHKIKDYWATTDCVWYEAYESDRDHYTVEIREKHTGGCPGDPLTNPLAAMFKIEKSTGSITWYDVSTDQFLDLSEYTRRFSRN
jgi:hypothetical protein